ncbi:DNA helicase [Microbacterium phage Gilda]|uniref:DNA helicase n=1 Tax=Microbacterium phage Gilda TaxID=2772024 RepID=A0A7L7SYU2_9CAUD|nr:DNA helicase [Microbacterium phage Gilda]
MKVHLSKNKNRVELRSGWAPDMASRCKSVPGANWSPQKKAWTYPLSMATLRALRREFGDQLAPEEALLAWARTERRREKRTKGYAAHHDAALKRVPDVSPVLAEAMADRTYQRSGAAFSRVAHNYLLADEPGLGKTATSLAGLIEDDAWEGAHLVIAPKTALDPTWGRQIRQWTPDAKVFVMPEGAVNRAKEWAAFLNDESATRFLIINPAMVRRLYGHYCAKCEVWAEDVKAKKTTWPKEHFIERGHPEKGKRTIRSESWPEIIEFSWTSITLDEAHDQLATYSPANVTQTMQGLLDIRKDAKLVALTGTPLHGQEKNLWGALDWFGVNTGGYWAFMESYMETRKGYFGIEVYGLDPEKSSEFHKLVDRYVLRRTRAEARPDLPLGQRVDVTVEMTPKHRKQYKEFEQEGEVAIAGGTLSGQGLLSELTRLRQMAWGRWEKWGDKLTPTTDSAKWEWLLEFLQARGITGKKTKDWLPEKGTAYKYVIASQFTEILDFLQEELGRKGIPALKITGGVTGRARTDAVAKFQSEDKQFRVMLIQTITGGVSIDLDAWCDEMVILDETFIADQQVQLEGRINNRSGRVSPRMWHYVRTNDTMDLKIAESNYGQHDLQHKLLDGRRGIKTALHLIRGDQ